MKTNYVCRTFDPYDGYTFDYHMFSDKASAKSCARHWKTPYNVGVSVWETVIEAPLHTKITKNNPIFDLLERDGYTLD